MLLEPPTVVSQNEITLSVREIEPLLQAPPMDVPPWPGATITLKDGRTMVIREARLEDRGVHLGASLDEQPQHAGLGEALEQDPQVDPRAARGARRRHGDRQGRHGGGRRVRGRDAGRARRRTSIFWRKIQGFRRD